MSLYFSLFLFVSPLFSISLSLLPLSLPDYGEFHRDQTERMQPSHSHRRTRWRQRILRYQYRKKTTLSYLLTFDVCVMCARYSPTPTLPIALVLLNFVSLGNAACGRPESIERHQPTCEVPPKGKDKKQTDEAELSYAGTPAIIYFLIPFNILAEAFFLSTFLASASQRVTSMSLCLFLFLFVSVKSVLPSSLLSASLCSSGCHGWSRVDRVEFETRCFLHLDQRGSHQQSSHCRHEPSATLCA